MLTACSRRHFRSFLESLLSNKAILVTHVVIEAHKSKETAVTFEIKR